jgi:hypothetical protein
MAEPERHVRRFTDDELQILVDMLSCELDRTDRFWIRREWNTLNELRMKLSGALAEPR